MSDESLRVWLVERTFSDDEQNVIILIYATLDGTQYYRKERALPTDSANRETTAAICVDRTNLGSVTEADDRARYATEATRMAETHDPNEAI